LLVGSDRFDCPFLLSGDTRKATSSFVVVDALLILLGLATGARQIQIDLHPFFISDPFLRGRGADTGVWFAFSLLV